MTCPHGSKWIFPATRLAIYARDRFTCQYCSKSVHADVPLTLDHVLPREHGGLHRSSNLLTACLRCNSARQHASYRTFFGWLRKEGVDTKALSTRISRQLSKPIDMDVGKELLALRKGGLHQVEVAYFFKRRLKPSRTALKAKKAPMEPASSPVVFEVALPWTIVSGGGSGAGSRPV